jgi:hypothetical protein
MMVEGEATGELFYRSDFEVPAWKNAQPTLAWRQRKRKHGTLSSHCFYSLSALPSTGTWRAMSRLRCIFQSPPFKNSYRPGAARLHACPPHLELPLQSRIRWSYFWYAGILTLGVTTGLGARQFAAPLGLPTPGSPEDKLIVESLSQDIDKLDVVQSLRKQSFNLHADTPLTEIGGGDKFKVKGWVEVDFNFVKGEETQDRSGILGALSGTRGFGVQRAFWNAETKEMVAVVWIGGGLAGWPGVAHGGAIATIFEEIMARMVKGPSGAVGMYIIQLQSHAIKYIHD